MRYLSSYKLARAIVFTLCLSILYNITFAQDNIGISADISFDTQVLNSYTPPFYEGKALASQKSDMKILANVKVSTPAGDLDSSKFYYYWTINDEMTHTYSKTGGNILYFTLSEFGTTDDVKLQIYSNNTMSMKLGEKSLKVSPVNTYPLLYRLYDNPILTYANSISKKYETYEVVPGDYFQIIAEPYYFSVKSPSDQSLSYTWSIDDIPGNIDNANTFIYSTSDNSRRNTKLGLKIENSTRVLQEGTLQVNIVLRK